MNPLKTAILQKPIANKIKKYKQSENPKSQNERNQSKDEILFLLNITNIIYLSFWVLQKRLPKYEPGA
ncbi:hypothetical protein [Leptospira weilii]|uniref:hypothetical protein n=1 Tax=Leptospira weilii TaxID=28184 RepID=UPI000774B0EC|nr:hypothetical protein [Leptospira weilii]